MSHRTRLGRAAPKTKKKFVGSAPLLPNLTEREWARVTAAYNNGLDQERELKSQAKDVPIARQDVRSFLELWSRMSPMAKGCLVDDLELAYLYEGKISRYRIEDRANEALWSLTAPRGRPAAIANVRAVEILADLWRARGGEIRPGRLYPEKKPEKKSGGAFGSDYSPNPFVKFVATALRRLDATLKTDGMAARRAKSAVDALQKMKVL